MLSFTKAVLGAIFLAMALQACGKKHETAAPEAVEPPIHRVEIVPAAPPSVPDTVQGVRITADPPGLKVPETAKNPPKTVEKPVKKAQKSSYPGDEVVALAFASVNADRVRCLREAVDAKVEYDIDLHKITDQGNVLREGLCGTGQYPETFDEALQRAKAYYAKKDAGRP